MPRSTPQRVLRLAVQVAIFLALMIGVLLRIRTGTLPYWEMMLRPLIIFVIGMILLAGRKWAKWPFSALCLAYAWWYLQAATRGSLPTEFRFGTGLGAFLEIACAIVVFAIAPVPDAPGRATRNDSSTAA
jgi:hypothetical protein